MIKAVVIKCRGRVQGVFFRATTKEVADKLGVNGWVKNEFDGTVSIHAEGDVVMVDQLVTWCHEGPDMSIVDSVNSREVEVKGFSGFEIKRF